MFPVLLPALLHIPVSSQRIPVSPSPHGAPGPVSNGFLGVSLCSEWAGQSLPQVWWFFQLCHHLSQGDSLLGRFRGHLPTVKQPQNFLPSHLWVFLILLCTSFISVGIRINLLLVIRVPSCSQPSSPGIIKMFKVLENFKGLRNPPQL